MTKSPRTHSLTSHSRKQVCVFSSLLVNVHSCRLWHTYFVAFMCACGASVWKRALSKIDSYAYAFMSSHIIGVCSNVNDPQMVNDRDIEYINYHLRMCVDRSLYGTGYWTATGKSERERERYLVDSFRLIAVHLADMSDECHSRVQCVICKRIVDVMCRSTNSISLAMNYFFSIIIEFWFEFDERLRHLHVWSVNRWNVINTWTRSISWHAYLNELRYGRTFEKTF